MNISPPKRYTVYFTGRVQGVGFRYNTASIARRHEVSGFVRNCPDGSVEVVAEGNPQEIDKFLREVRDNFFSNIRNERRDVQDATGEFTGFDIRH
jgi:acylphosphatase